MSRAFVFPGQGAQTIGMGRDLADAYPAARAVFEEVDAALGENLSELIWSGEADDLTLTRNAQPALMATSIAALRALEAEGIALAETVSHVAGHSLGEYSALVAAGSLSLADAARLLRIRGEAMQSAVPVGVGAMAALLGLGFAEARAVAEEAAQGQVCQAANDNDPGQVVVSGHREAVERAIEIAKAKGARRAMLLPVSAPFHCGLMAARRPRHGRGAGRRRDRPPRRPADRQRHGATRVRCGADPRAARRSGDGLRPLARKRGDDGGARRDRDLGNRRGQGAVGDDPADRQEHRHRGP